MVLSALCVRVAVASSQRRCSMNGSWSRWWRPSRRRHSSCFSARAVTRSRSTRRGRLPSSQSSAVLVALLSEMTRLYVRLSIGVASAAARARQQAHELGRRRELHRARNQAAAHGHHDVQRDHRGACCASRRSDTDDVQVNLDDMTSASARIAETIDSLRGLFKNPQEAQQHGRRERRRSRIARRLSTPSCPPTASR